MPDSVEARLAALVQRVTDLGGDVNELADEQRRTRERLHQVEGLTGGLVDESKQRRREADRGLRRLELRMQMLTVAIAGAAVIEPFLYHLATGK